MDRLTKMIRRHEGFRQYPYKDSLGVLTIGYGFNLDHWMAYGIPREEADALLGVKVRIAEREASFIPGWGNCNEVRRAVLADMTYNMGIARTLKFKKMIAALKAGDFSEAAAQILDSRFARQTGSRAVELAAMMRTGEWQEA
ncbi:MAG: glycoside hydrolase [Deltaproteobacteria bacterium]|nr:MAG: glycoside hydrolase [Deltaproteobacteria bacterium]